MGWLSLKDLGRIGGYEVCRAVFVIVDILFVVAALLCEEEELVSSRTQGGWLVEFCHESGEGGRGGRDDSIAIEVGCLILGRFL